LDLGAADVRVWIEGLPRSADSATRLLDDLARRPPSARPATPTTTCGRYASSRKAEDLVEEFEIDKVEVKETLAPDYNVAPTKQVYAVVQRPSDPEDKEGASERQLRTLKWGLVPFWAKDPSVGNKMINARMETVHEKPAFRRPFASRRCLLPADGYYEWYATEQKTKAGKPLKQPFFIHPADGSVMAMAG